MPRDAVQRNAIVRPPGGGGVALANQFDNVFTAAMIGNSGTLNVAWVVNNGTWQPPVPIS